MRDIPRRFALDLWQVITSPSQFFKKVPSSGGLAGPLTFALVTHWIGAALEFLWNTGLGGFWSRAFHRFFEISEWNPDWNSDFEFIETKDRILNWFTGAGPILIDPFLTLVSVLFTSALVFVGARILVSHRQTRDSAGVTYESALRIVSYGLSPAILAGLPLVGSLVAPIWVLWVTVVGARELYRVSTTRALVIALFPKLLFMGIIGMGLFLVLIFFLKFFAMLVA